MKTLRNWLLVGAATGLVILAILKVRDQPDSGAAPPGRGLHSERSSEDKAGAVGQAAPIGVELPASFRRPPTLADLSVQMRALAASCEAVALGQREDRLREYCAGLEKMTLRRLLARLEEVAPETLRADLQKALFLRLAELDPAATAALAESLLEGEQRDAIFAALVREWGEADALGAARWLANRSIGPLMEPTAAWLAERLAKEHPVLAGQLIVALPSAQTRLDALDRFVTEWGGRDFEPALKWARDLPGGEARERALLHLSYDWERTDFEGALDFARNLPDGEDRLAIALGNRWAKRDPNAAAQWAAALPEGVRQEKVLASLAATWAQAEPRMAGEFVLSLPAGAAQQAAAISVVSAWAAREPASVAQWVEGFPSGRDREYAIENLVFRWVQSDPAAAAAWVERWPAGSDREAAINTGAGVLIESRPALAAHWAAAIREESSRHRQMERVARQWLLNDPVAARAWITQSSLPAAAREALSGPTTR